MAWLPRGCACALVAYYLQTRLGFFLLSRSISQREPSEDGSRGVLINTASVAAYDGQIGQVARLNFHGMGY